MVNKPGDQVSRIIAGCFVLVVVVFVIVLVRENQQNRLQPSANEGTKQTQISPSNSSQVMLTVETPGVDVPSGSVDDRVYYLPQDVTMEMVTDMSKNPDGSVNLFLNNGQKVMVSVGEIPQLDSKIRLYVQYNLEEGDVQ